MSPDAPVRIMAQARARVRLGTDICALGGIALAIVGVALLAAELAGWLS